MHFGRYETFGPALAIKMEERPTGESQKKEYWLHLRDDVFWQPLKASFFSNDLNLAPQFFEKTQVTAHDIVFYFNASMNPYVGEPGAASFRSYYSGIEEIKAIDDFTLVVRWKTEDALHNQIKYSAKGLTGALTPLPRFVYQYFSDGRKIIEDDSDPSLYRTSALWAGNFSRHWAINIIVSCGPWSFNGMTEREIVFVRNEDYFNSLEALAQKRIISFKETPDALWQLFKSNKIDTYLLQPEQRTEFSRFQNSKAYLDQKTAGDEIRQIDYVDRMYTYIGWNNAKPWFNSKKIRQAMTMAIDRKRIIEQNLNGMGIEITCPFSPESPSYDSSIEPWPFDPEKAKRYLAEEGWYDSTGSGVISKVINGRKLDFRFTLTYYVKNSLTKAISEYIATALKEISIECNLNGVDIADLSKIFSDKSFDAVSLGWALGTPPEDPKQLWYSAGAKEAGSSNAISFQNKEADQIIEALEYEYDKDKRIALYHRFDAIIHDEAPYTFLYAPKSTLLYRDYVKNVFIPSERQDLIPGANVAVPESSIFWLKR